MSYSEMVKFCSGGFENRPPYLYVEYRDWTDGKWVSYKYILKTVQSLRLRAEYKVTWRCWDMIPSEQQSTNEPWVPDSSCN